MAVDELAAALQLYALHARPATTLHTGRAMAAVAAEGDGEATSGPPAGKKDPLVMYVVLRKDLDWPMGAMVNQACHAASAVSWESREDPQAIAYLTQAEGQMTTVTMGAKDEAELQKAADRLKAAGIPYKVWVEQPEGVSSALATWPRRRSEMQKCFKGLKLF
eukprot:gnl/TRDRNA2_/TRDRNA2_117587_c0_seq2.p1 gnl/TRDRNA2_/TRDRNA2_117587_c0~~gnl/TRDRNA2_/TRDRNA2_117587_c0_seq2.p1  ORF type:complete len:163 (+),score=43.36 gnl/TRDRNA2_/TRDRNA2_117587_c0_seq2:40-528(+)